MPRTERPLEDDGSPLVEFAAELRKLRAEAGSPPYRELARQAHYSSTTLSDAAGGRQLPSLAVTLAYVEACGGDRDEWERRWHDVAAELNGHANALPPESGNAPYVGLSAYGPDDAELFFGRERLVEDLRSRLRRHRFLAVFGPSGAGKSSTLRAGLIPALYADSPLNPIVLFTPGAHPLHEWALHLSSLLGATTPAVSRDLATGPAALCSLIDQLLAEHPAGAEVVFVVDQFEEVFTLCTDAGERQAFLELLLNVGPRGRVVVGVRADFYAHCALHPELAEALQDAQVTVGPMTADELRRAIVRPARIVGCAVESDLLSVLVAHAHGQAGSLPLLSHALLQTWRRRKGNMLTLVGFQTTGGFEGALARTAETVFGGMTTPQQGVTQHLFRRLIALGDGTEDTKRRVRRAELDDTADVQKVLNTLSDARLLTLDRDTVEITHEALISAWPRLQRWLNADREGHRLHRELTDAAVVWQTHGRDPSTLLRGNRLALIADWAAEDVGLTELEQTFLEASVAAQEQEQSSTRLQIRRQRILIAVLTVLVLVVTAALIFASRAQDNATQQRNTALALRAVQASADLINADPRSAAKVALTAYRIHPSPETAGALISAAAAVRGVRFLEPYREIVVGADVLVLAGIDDDKLTIYSITEDKLEEKSSVPAGKSVHKGGMAVRPDGRLGMTTGFVTSPSISPDSQVLLTPADEEGQFIVWDISDVRQPVRQATISATQIGTWSPDSRHVLAIETNPALTTVWSLSDLAKPVVVGSLPGSRSWFAGRHDRVALLEGSGNDQTVAVHEVPAHGQPQKIRVFGEDLGGSVHDVRFSDDGERVTVVQQQGMQQRVSTWPAKTGNSQPLTTRSFPQGTFISLHTGTGGSTDPVVVVETQQSIALWESRDLTAQRWVLPLPTGNDGKVALGHLSSRLDALFVLMNFRFYQEWRRLDLDIAGAVRSACGKTVDTYPVEVWAEHFPGVEQVPLCP